MSTSIDQKGIATIIGSLRLSVPTHQRSFEWTADEVGEMLEDFLGAFQHRREEYFFGSIVVIADPTAEHHDVLDGQQRLATVSLLLASLADEFEDRDEKAAHRVRQSLSSYDIDRGEDSPHLRLNRDDDPFFRTLLRPGYTAPEPSNPESHTLLYGAREQTKNWIRAHARASADPLIWLRDMYKFLRDTVRVIYFAVPDDSNAFLIFETLNDRGLDLSIADLLKNYLLSRAGDVEAVLALWTRTLTTLKAFGYEKDFTVFLRHYWSSKYEVVREKELYRRIKTRVTTATNVIEFATELQKNSYLYTALLSPEHEYWSAATDATRERLRTLAVLGLEQYRPMLLAAIAHLELPAVETIVQMLEAWNVRLVVVGGLGGGVMEAKYAELGRAIRDGEIKNPSELADRARAFVPNDVEFESKFAVATVSKVALARYYLRALELVAASGEIEKIPNPRLTLEHVLPERAGGNYPQFSDEEKRLYTRRLGNLALLTHKINSDLKSAPYPEKREIYLKSALELTRSIADSSDWSVAAINDRQRKLAGLALKAWALPKT